jgi:hypothetical protein
MLKQFMVYSKNHVALNEFEGKPPKNISDLLYLSPMPPTDKVFKMLLNQAATEKKHLFVVMYNGDSVQRIARTD